MYSSSYYDTSASAAAGGIIGAVFAFLGVFILIAVALAVLQIIGTWKILTKAKQPGWGSLIPFYNQYLLCKITGVNPWWILIVVLSPILNVIPIIGSIASMAVSIYFLILLNVSLGIKDDNYLGEKPMNDIVFKKVSGSINNSNQQTSNNFATGEDVKFCSKCGAKVDADTKFCPSCGTEMN